MAENTAIEWCDHTFNPWEGCQKVGPGCDHCYAETRNARFGGGVAVNWGPGAPRRHTSASNWQQPVRWNAQAEREGRRFRVFCASLADVFDNAVPVQWRIELMRLIMSTPNLDWLLLTKRIGNAAEMLEKAFRGHTAQREGWRDNVPPNVWIGATVVNQEEADRDIQKLLATPAAVRFLSMEPLLAPVDLEQACDIAEQTLCAGTWATMSDPQRCHLALRHGSVRLLDWVIVGGESGPGARPMHPDWACSLRDQCDEAGVPFLFKQWGEWQPISQQLEAFTSSLYVSNRKAAPHEDQSAIDESYGRRCTVDQTVQHLDGSVHHFLEPNAFPPGAMTMYRVGKKPAGRLLDGCTHDGFPGGAA